MAKLIVTPIDFEAPGSYYQVKRAMALGAKLGQMGDAASAAAVLDEAEQFLRNYVRTDDGSSIDEAFAQLSFKDFCDLLGAISLKGGEDTVPPESEGSLSSG